MKILDEQGLKVLLNKMKSNNSSSLPYDLIGGPGNRVLLEGDMEAGFFGELAPGRFISGDELASLVGITAGTSINSNTPWFKLAYKDSIFYTPKLMIRHNLSWDDIKSANCVYGDKTFKHLGKKYAIMLMRGVDEKVQPDPKKMNKNYNDDGVYDSMWNKFLCPLNVKAPNGWEKNVKNPTEAWGKGYSNSEMGFVGNSNLAWCQETIYDEDSRLVRGVRYDSDITYSTMMGSNFSNNIIGWRPVLKLIG